MSLYDILEAQEQTDVCGEIATAALAWQLPFRIQLREPYVQWAPSKSDRLYSTVDVIKYALQNSDTLDEKLQRAIRKGKHREFGWRFVPKSKRILRKIRHYWKKYDLPQE